MPQLKPAYLIHGDDHGAVAQRRAGLRALAEGSGGGTVAVEVLEGERATPALLAGALATMTLSGSGTINLTIAVESRYKSFAFTSALLAVPRELWKRDWIPGRGANQALKGRPWEVSAGLV